jgi:hypothetical protein
MARLRITPTTAAVIADSAADSAKAVAAQPLDERRAEEDPQEAGREGHPGGEQAAERPGEHRRQPAGLAEGAHEADELGDHDQRPGRRLGHAEPVEHLARREPAIMLDRLLGDIGEHRIGAAERHHRHLREEEADLAEDIVRAEQGEQQRHRRQPEQQEDRRDAQRPAQFGRAWSGTPRRAPSRVGDGRPPRRGRRRREGREPAPAAEKPIRPAARTISGNGTAKKKMAMKAPAAIAAQRCLSARAPIRRTASRTIASTAAFSPKNRASTAPTLPKAA